MFLYSRWQSLDINTRHKIAKQFGIIKRGSTEVVNDQIKSDGYAIKEIEEALNIDAIQIYLEVTETDMMTLWLWLIDKIEGRELTQVNIDTTVIPHIVMEDGINYKIDQNIVDDAKRFVETKKYATEMQDNLVAKSVKPKRGRKPKAK